MDDDLVVIGEEGKPITTSLKVAETFRKRHDNLLGRIENIECSPEFGLLNFKESSYINSQNKPQPMYEMTRDGWSASSGGHIKATSYFVREVQRSIKDSVKKLLKDQLQILRIGNKYVGLDSDSRQKRH